MSAFTVPSSREPVIFTDPSGKPAFSRPWFLFFQQLFDRVGGSSSPSIPDIAESLDDGDTDTQLAAAVYALQDEVRGAPLALAPASADPLIAEISGLRDELAELRKTVEGIQQGTSL